MSHTYKNSRKLNGYAAVATTRKERKKAKQFREQRKNKKQYA